MRHAVQRMQEAETARRKRTLAEFELHLTESQREEIRLGIEEGIRDVENRRYEAYDARGLKNLGNDRLDASAKKVVGPAKARRTVGFRQFQLPGRGARPKDMRCRERQWCHAPVRRPRVAHDRC